MPKKLLTIARSIRKNKLIFSVFCVVFLIFVFADYKIQAAPITVTFQEGVNGYSGTVDNTLRSLTDHNYGASGLGIRSDYRPIIKFDLSQIPTDSIISQCDLGFYTNLQYSGLSQTGNAYLLTESWTEGSIGGAVQNGSSDWYHRQHDASLWTAEGGTYDNNLINSVTVNDINQWFTLDLLSACQKWINQGFANNGIIIIWNGGNRWAAGSEDTNLSLRPKLTITYSSAGSQDIISPVRSGGSPSGTLSAGTNSTTLSLITNENASCKYSATSNTPYSLMTGAFSTVDSISHSAIISGLVDGSSYTYYVRCQDTSGNINADDYAIYFLINTVVSGLDIPIIYLKFDEGSGSTAIDSSGGGNSGTIVGATWVNGKSGQALDFKNSGNYVSVNIPSNFNFNEGTISFWYKPNYDTNNTIGVIHTLFIVGPNSYTAGRVQIWNNREYQPIRISHVTDILSYTHLSVGNWYQIVYTWDSASGQKNYYLNGIANVSASSSSWIANTAPTEIYIGKNANQDSIANGVIDEVRVYNKALNSIEVQKIYTETISPAPVIADTQAPSVPSNLKATAVFSSQIDLSWSVSTDNVGVTGYKIFRNDIQIATSSSAVYSDLGLTPSTNYAYTVSAYDSANNNSLKSSVANTVTYSTTATNTDNYGGCTNCGLNGTATGFFHIEKISNRWWIITPLGNPIIVFAPSGIDTVDIGGSGGFLAYEAVYLKDASNNFSSNLKNEAENTYTKDVINPLTNVTLSRVGDEIYFGRRTRPTNPYFWLDQLGAGGKVQWYYSTSGGWKLINGTGNPAIGAVLNTDKSYNLDIGNTFAPDANGFIGMISPMANRIVFWSNNKFPSDFSFVTLPNDIEPRFYIKGVVIQDFSTPPILNRVHERSYLSENILKKYGDYNNWGLAISNRLKSWGFNATGMYSFRYWGVRNNIPVSSRLPIEHTWQLSGWAMRGDYPYKIKGVYDGAVCPPGSATLRWQGGQVDVFDPGYKVALETETKNRASGLDKNSAYSFIPEEADQLFGMNSTNHDHLGYITISQNPYKSKNNSNTISYTDTKLYSKYALRDFLRYRYKDQNENLSVFTTDSATVPFYIYSISPSGGELKALQNLNAAWGTNYTTWDTSSGNFLDGTNAYGLGTGFMDENGKNILYGGVCKIGYNGSFTNPSFPNLRQDLDDFVAFFSEKYAKTLSSVLNLVSHPSTFLPLYNGPDYVYRAVAPYFDGFWVNPGGIINFSSGVAENLLRIYNIVKKPLIISDYAHGTIDSPAGYKGVITSVSYDPVKKRTRFVAPDSRYIFRVAQSIWFPDVPISNLPPGYYPYPRIRWVNWDNFEVDGDLTKAITPGTRFEIASNSGDGELKFKTQEERARAMVNHYNTVLNLKGDDGNYFVVGFEHWSLYDNEISDWGEIYAFGLATPYDNAYDGVEARKIVSKDGSGYDVGGEEADYGNLLGNLSSYLKKIYNNAAWSSKTPAVVDINSPIVSDIQATVTTGSATVNWNTNEPEPSDSQTIIKQKTPSLSYTFTKNLGVGLKNDNEDVKNLQKILVLENLFPQNSVTGYFDEQTKVSVIQFQIKYKISPALGFVGSLTRAKLQELFGEDAALSSQAIQSMETNIFIRNLSLGISGDDVKTLQELLVKDGFLPSYHTRTNFFGKLTKQAVITFQKHYNIQPALGFVGQLTRAKFEELRKGVSAFTTAVSGILVGPFAFGFSNDQVTLLQQMLSHDPEIYPEAIITGYYGPLTEAAVKRFQQKYGIEQTGIAGPQTRVKLNELYAPASLTP